MFEKRGFEPIFDSRSEILILGSFPSKMSFLDGFYYGNPRNRFWQMMQEFFQVELTSIEAKKQFLLAQRIALWDIVYLGSNQNSLDKNLLPIEISNLERLFLKADFKKILCNGKKAYTLFCKYYPHLKDSAKALPSTSPANFKFNSGQWKAELLE